MKTCMSNEQHRPLLAMFPLVPLLLCAPRITCADQPAQDPHVKAQSDLVAASICHKRGFPFMVRLGKHDVLCLETNVGIEKQVVDVERVLKGDL